MGMQIQNRRKTQEKRTGSSALVLALLLCILMSSGGCEKKSDTKRVDMEFTVCDDSRVPDVLMKLMQEKKGKGFQLSYINGENLYIAIGYGEHDRGNLNVVVEELYKTERNICVKTRLATSELTPTDGEHVGECSMYPYIVLRCERLELPIIFEILGISDAVCEYI